MANVEVRRILVDQGSAVDVIFEDLLEVLKISHKDLTPYTGKYLTGFNGASTTLVCHLELMVTYGDPESEGEMFRNIKTAFLVLPCKSVYQCIIGRPTLGKLEAVTSTVHLKMKFYNLENEVVTIPAYLGATQRCYFLGLKLDKQAAGPPEACKWKGRKAVMDVIMVDLRTSCDLDPQEEERKSDLTKEPEKSKGKLKPADMTLTLQLSEDFAKMVKLDSDHPEGVKSKLLEQGRRLQKKGKFETTTKALKLKDLMEFRERLSLSERYRNYRLQPNVARKEVHSSLKARLHHPNKRPRPSQKRGTFARERSETLGDPDEQPCWSATAKGLPGQGQTTEKDDSMNEPGAGYPDPKGKGSVLPTHL